MHTYKLLIALIAAIAALAFFVSLRLISLKELQIRHQAVDGCLQSSGIYEYTDSNNQVHSTAPQKEYYTICLSDKGYSSTWK